MKKIKFFNAIILTLCSICASSFLYTTSAMEKTINVQTIEKSQKNILSDYTDRTIDPQYEVIKNNMCYQYKLNDVLLYTKNNKTGKYKNVKTKKVFDKLPAVDDKYIIKKHKKTGKIFYFLNENPAYELQEKQSDFIIYSDVNDSNRKFYSKKGKKLYYQAEKGDKYFSLPEPNVDIIDNFKCIKYPSAKYYDLCKKSLFFKPTTEEAFDKKYKEEYNIYDYMNLEDTIIVNNVRDNLCNKGENFRFVIDPKAEEKLNKLNNQGAYDFTILERISRNITKNIRSSFADGQGKRFELSNLVDPQYKTIKFGDICWYCYDGKIKFYRNLINGKYYDLKGTKYNNITRADMNSNYKILISRDNQIKYKVGNNIFDVTSEDGKVWFSLNGNKKFYAVQGKPGYINLARNKNLKLGIINKNLNNILDNDRLAKKYFDNLKADDVEYAEDPQYEIVNLNGKNIYFFEGLPRYIKSDNGYYNINNGKIYSKLPIVNADYYCDEEYEVIKQNNRLYYYIDKQPAYVITQTKVPINNYFTGYNKSYCTLLTYCPVQYDNPYGTVFTSIKGRRGYNFKTYIGSGFVISKKVSFI